MSEDPVDNDRRKVLYSQASKAKAKSPTAQQDLAIRREQARRYQQNSRDRETSRRSQKVRTHAVHLLPSTFSNSSMYSGFSSESVCLFTGLPDLRH